MSRELDVAIEQAEECIVAGKIREAAELLAKVKLSALPRPKLVKMAQLFRRVGSYDQSLRLLMPIVRPKARLLQPATSTEIAEYAICLQRAGSIEEARDLLEQVSEDEVPEALLYKAIFLFPDWEYAAAIPSLERLIQITPTDSYLHHVGRLNLSAALVTVENYEGAESVLARLRVDTANAGHQLLLCNALEVSAQVAIFSNDLNAAEKFLDGAEKVLSGVKTFEKLWLVKWRSIIKTFRSGDIRHLGGAREEALRKNHWETLRELDFISCKVAYNPDLARKLFFGTAAPAYRARLARHFEVPRASSAFVLPGAEYRAHADGALHCLKDFSGQLSPGDLPHLALLMLLSDAYRGLRSGQIHSRLFPGDFFNPDTSLDRVHQVMKRVRKEVGSQLPGVKVEQVDGVYTLDLKTLDNPLEVPAVFPALETGAVKLRAFELSLKEKRFESKDVQGVLSISRAAANRLISSWREQGLVEVDGGGRAPVYKIKTAA